MTKSHLIGVIPAAGLGKRIWPYFGPKELLPVGYQTRQLDKGFSFVPKVVSQYILEAMQRAGVKNVFVVISRQKLEILNFYGSGERFGMNIGYLCQEQPRGMPGAIDLAVEWARDRIILMGMPDTILEPADCFVQLLEFHRQKNADLSLGVFPTQNPRSLAPVHLEPSSGRVLEVFDKPAEPICFNTWGIAVWGSIFMELLHAYVHQPNVGENRELLLSEIFSEALHQGLRVYGKFFPNGKYYDVGTPEGLLKTRLALEYRQVVAALGNEIRV